LAYEYDPEKPLTPQLEEVLNKIKFASVKPQDPKWKKQLLKKLLTFKHSLAENKH